MNFIKRLLVAVIAVVSLTMAANAQFRIGPRVGLNVNQLRFNKELFNSDNRAGVTAGVQVEFTVPIVNLGFDASVMYTRRNSQYPVSTVGADGITYQGRDFISVPINLKYKLGLPVVGKVFSPYFFTGPDFGFLCSKREIQAAYKEKKVDVAWNFGLGFQFFSHLQIGASYGLGITKAVEFVSSYEGADIKGRNSYWTVTAAWLF